MVSRLKGFAIVRGSPEEPSIANTTSVFEEIAHRDSLFFPKFAVGRRHAASFQVDW